MVKRTVLTRQCKKFYNSSPTKKPRKNLKSKKKTPRKSRGRLSTTLHSVFTPPVECSPTKMVNSSSEATPINLSFTSDSKCDTNKGAMSESVIEIDDTFVEDADSSTRHLADESCFIIDVEPSSDTEKSIYKFVSDDTANEEKSITEKQDGVQSNDVSPSGDVKATTSEISGTIPQTEDSCHSSMSEGTSHSSDSNCISLDDESKDGSDSHSNDDNSNNGEGKFKEITPDHVEMWNGIVVQMKNDGFLRENNNYNSKRSSTEELGPNKRFASDSGESKPESWHVYKKSLGGTSSSTDPTSKNSRLSAQNLASKRLINKENRGRDDKNNEEGTTSPTDENCICIDDDSDSDIEFVNAFNPADRLIELSDDEGSVIFEDVIPPPKVILLKNNIRRRIYGKRKKKSVGSTNKTPDHTVDDKLPSVRTPDAGQNSEKPKKVTKQMKRKRKAKEAKEAAKEAVIAADKPKPQLRPIVIDGCNVAHGHGRAGKMSVEGLQICYDYFHSRGHDVKVFLPSYKKFHPTTTNVQLLVEMESKGIVIFTPGRTVNGKKINSYDDRFILEYATLKGGIVITRDNYRDLYAEREEFRDTITNRLLQYTFVDDLIMFPDDPLGRNGPRLEEFLQFPASSGSNKTNDPSSSKS